MQAGTNSLRCAACGVDRPAGSFSAMQRKKADQARCKSCLKHGVEETLRRERLAAEPHVRWAEPVVGAVREIPSRAQNGAAQQAAAGGGIASAGDTDWRWARGERSMSAQSARMGMLPPSDSDTSSSEEEQRFFSEMCIASRRGDGDAQPERADCVLGEEGAAEALTPDHMALPNYACGEHGAADALPPSLSGLASCGAGAAQALTPDSMAVQGIASCGAGAAELDTGNGHTGDIRALVEGPHQLQCRQ